MIYENYLETQELEEEREKQLFQVTDDHKANWALKKIKQLKADQEYNSKFAEEEIRRTEEWLESINKPLQESIDHFQSLLGAYALEKREIDPSFKTSKLPNGAIRFKKQQPAFKYDNHKVIDSLKKAERTDLIRVKEEPDKTAIKKAFVINKDRLINPETGEFVDGVTIEHREDKFEVVTEWK